MLQATDPKGGNGNMSGMIQIPGTKFYRYPSERVEEVCLCGKRVEADDEKTVMFGVPGIVHLLHKACFLLKDAEINAENARKLSWGTRVNKT